MKTSVRIAVLLCLLQVCAVAQSFPTQALRGHVPKAVAGLTATGRLQADEELNLAIGLPLRNKAALTNLLQNIYDPASPNYHRYLTPAQFADQFGPSAEDYRAVTAFAQSNGLRITATHANRALLDVSGSVSNIEKTFHVALRTYRHPSENRTFFAPDTEPSLDLAAPVLHVSGLDNYHLPQPMSLTITPIENATGAPSLGSGPRGTYMGNDFRAAYVPGLALTGSGQSVGLLEFNSGYLASDIASYESMTGLPAVPLKNVLLDGYGGGPGTANDEVSLDIEMAISMAPGLSSVIVYEGKVADDLLNRMATDDLANQLSSSWTYSIDAVSEQIFQEFAAQGQSYFNASGDADAYVDPSKPPPTPSDDSNVTSVGGTTLITSGPGGAWVSESVWNWDVEYGVTEDGRGSSGGISETYSIPSWQQGINMSLNHGSTTARNLPDVALTADNVFVVYSGGINGDFGGTSCATPLWAAYIALANEQAAAYGHPTIGFINPAIYAIGSSTNYASCFHDIVIGNNAWSGSPTNFFAVQGYDLCTGWGTPAGGNLIDQLAPPDALQVSPLGGFTASGGAGGPLMPACDNFILTNGGSMALQWSAGASAPWISLSSTGGTLTPGGNAATVTVSLNAAASNLFLGTYGATVWFTNQTDGSVQSRPVILTIIKPPAIISQPPDVITGIGGQTINIAVVVGGGLPMNLQWQCNGSNLANGGGFSGVQSNVINAGNIYATVTNTLTISNVSPADSGSYSLVASNAAGVATSSPAGLNITPSGPVIVQQPASQLVYAGANAMLSVVADGSAPLAYQWQLNGTNLVDNGNFIGSTNSALSINSASSADIGTYTVVVSNSIDTVASAPAVINVDVPLISQQLVQNSGFETGNFSAWVESGNFTDSSVSASFSAAHSGGYGALLGPVGALGYLSQSLATTNGQLYLLSLWLDSPDGLAPNEFLVAWNGSVLFDQTNLGAIGWTNLQFEVTATGSNTVLQIGFRDDESFLGLDDIQVTPLENADGPPIVINPPASQVAAQGSAATFAVLSAGQFPLAYQWQFDGTNLAHATNAALILTNLSTNQSGSYAVLVSNSGGFALSSTAALTVLPGTEEVINFDDLGTNSSGSPLPGGYTNLIWSNFYYLDPAQTFAPTTNGYTAGTVSAPNVAFNAQGTGASISAPASFSLLSAYLTAAWNDGLHVEAKGYLGQNLIYDNTYTLSATAPTLVNFNYVGVTSVQFNSSDGSPHPGYLGSGEEFVMDNLSIVLAPPPPLEILYSFSGFDGGVPAGALVQAKDGTFYGTTLYGGSNNEGTVFKMTTNGVLTSLFSFGFMGSVPPTAALTVGIDGNLYGTTPNGGKFGFGTVFRITTNGVFTPLCLFDSTNGANPQGSLLQSADGHLYGTTSVGGANGYGTVYKLTTDGVLTTLYSFDSTNGAYPYCTLVQGADGLLYGTTDGGGTNYGTVFSLTTNGAITTLASFNSSLTGSDPMAGVVIGADGYLYGTTYFGGLNSDGTVFRVATNNSNAPLTVLASFNFQNGAYPASTLAQGPDGAFYGTTSDGGAYDDGTAFKLTVSGATASLLTVISFEGTNGITPGSAFTLGNDGVLYGTAEYGGAGFNGASESGDGIVFRLGPPSVVAPPSIVTQLAGQNVPVNGTAIFNINALGAPPLSYSWARDGIPLPGANQSSYAISNVQQTDSGAVLSCVISNAYGSITSSNAALTVFNGTGPIYTFSGPDGAGPSAPLIQGSDGNFYGTTTYGGIYNNGTVFRVTTNGLYTTLCSFNVTNGAQPVAALMQGTDGNFYGTTEGGGLYNCGTVFRMTPDGTVTTIHLFGYSDGAYPEAPLIQGADGNFYGTTAGGGRLYIGTVFSMTTNGTLTTICSFNYQEGIYPTGPLVQGPHGTLYGTTQSGGPSDGGVIFSVTTNGVVSILTAFDYGSLGGSPYGGLIRGADGYLYGTTMSGGDNGDGTAFKIATNNTNGAALLQTFSAATGISPAGTLFQASDGNFYGTTQSGGTYGDGTVFRLTANGTLSNLFSFDGSAGFAPEGGVAEDNGGNLYTTTSSGGWGFDGQSFSGEGSIFRLSDLVFTGLAPVITGQPASVTVPVGGTVVFNVSANGAPSLFYYWQRNGSPITGATNPAYSLSNVQLTDSGAQFSCLVSNADGSVPSSIATLTVVAPSLAQNSGFELGSFTNWLESGNFKECYVTNAPFYVHSGNYGAELGPVGSLGFLSQAIPTIAGQVYQISCWIHCDGEVPNEFLVAWNGSTLFDATNLPASDWTELELTAAATAASTPLEFGFRDDSSFLGLDDISVEPAPFEIGSAQVSGGDLVLNGINGIAGQTNYVLTSTNLAVPLNLWKPIATNVLNASGNFTITVTNAVSPSAAQQFFSLELK